MSQHSTCILSTERPRNGVSNRGPAFDGVRMAKPGSASRAWEPVASTTTPQNPFVKARGEPVNNALKRSAMYACPDHSTNRQPNLGPIFLYLTHRGSAQLSRRRDRPDDPDPSPSSRRRFVGVWNSGCRRFILAMSSLTSSRKGRMFALHRS